MECCTSPELLHAVATLAERADGRSLSMPSSPLLKRASTKSPAVQKRRKGSFDLDGGLAHRREPGTPPAMLDAPRALVALAEVAEGEELERAHQRDRRARGGKEARHEASGRVRPVVAYTKPALRKRIVASVKAALDEAKKLALAKMAAGRRPCLRTTLNKKAFDQVAALRRELDGLKNVALN